MFRTAVTLTLTATLTTVAAVGTAQAASPCTSEYIKFRDFFLKFGAIVAKGLCTASSSKDVASAQKCLADYDKYVQKGLELLAKHNAANSDSQFTVGPRPLGEAAWKTGKLQAQRTWVGLPVLSDTYRVQVERTGGKAKSTVSGTVCFLDDKGESVKSSPFSVSEGQATFDQTFAGVAGLSPVVLLSMPLEVFNAHQYRIMGTRGGEPQIVLDARQTSSGGSLFKFSSAGPIPAMSCTRVNEDSDPAGWSDNYFCAASDIGMKWSPAGPIPGMRCTQVVEPAEPASTNWTDNYLCLPASTGFALQWSYAGQVQGKTCVPWNEPADPHTWGDNFMCY